MYIDKIKRFFKKLNIQSWFLIYILMQSIMPIVAVLTSKFLTTYFYMGVVVISVLFTMFACRLLNIREFFFLLLPFMGYQFLMLFASTSEDVLLAGYQVLLFMMPVCIGYYVFYNGKNYSFFSGFIAVIIAITAVTTIIGCNLYPEASRTLASTASSQDETALTYWWHNIGGYGFVYSSVLLYPCAILAFKMKKLHIVLFVGITILMLALVINAEYSLALMFFMVSILMLFIKKDISVKKFLLLLILFVLIVVLFRTAIATLLTRLGGYLGNEGMMEKINVLFLGKESVEGFDDARDELYLLSFKTFLSHPFFGTFKIQSRYIGGHSFILDNLASFGLLGGSMMFFMYRGIYKVFFRPFSGRSGYYLVFWIFLQTLILSTVNTGMWLPNLCVYVPVILTAVYGRGNSNENTVDRQYSFKPAKLLPVSEKE